MEQKMQRMTTKKMRLNLHTKKSVGDDILLPNDIIIEILSWLPAKSLLRLRCTCKYWFDLVTNTNKDDSFIKLHLHRSSTTTTISSSVFSFCSMVSGNPKKLSLGYYYMNYNNDTTPPPAHVVTSEVDACTAPEQIEWILGSSNGLISLFIKSLCKCNLIQCMSFSVCILNPCTKEYRVLPCPLPIEQADDNEKRLRVTYGFGYDQTIDDYKVIRIFKHDTYYSLDNDDIQVYTLRKNSWRRIIVSNIPDTLEACWYIPGVFMNGALYWMDSSGHNIVSFDIGKEKFQHVLKTPNLLNGRLKHSYKLQVFEGSLCLLLTINPVEIWVLKDCIMNNNNESKVWTMLLTIPNLNFYSIKLLKLLRYTSNGEMLMLNNNEDLVLYDPKNTSHQTLSRICEDRGRFAVIEVYTESLVSLNSGTYMDQQQQGKEHNRNMRNNNGEPSNNSEV